MLKTKSLILALVWFLGSTPAIGQQSATQAIQRDQQGLSILMRAAAGAGGASLIGGIRDFTGSGTITYYWGDEDVHGSVVVRGRGLTQFRLDANLPNGTRTWLVNGGIGSIRGSDGTVTSMAPHNTSNFGSLTLPYVYLASVLQDPSIAIAYIGLEAKNGHQTYHIRTNKVLASEYAASSEIIARLTTRDFFIDSVSLLVVCTVDMLHPEFQATVDFPHEMQFSNYRLVGGVLVPLSITELVNNQPMFQIELNQVNFNLGLADTIFDL